MPIPAERCATYEDLCRVPALLVARISQGEWITLPRPAPIHARAASMMARKLVPPLSTVQFDRVEKLGVYAAHGVVHAWLVDPDAQTLEVFALHEGALAIAAGV